MMIRLHTSEARQCSTYPPTHSPGAKDNPPRRSFAATGILLLTLAAQVLFPSRRTWGAEPDARPMLWIYTRAKGCPPCAALKREFKEQRALLTFDLTWLDGSGYEVPYIYYRDGKGKWVKRGGWTYGEYPEFLAQWKRDTGKRDAGRTR